MNIKNKSLFYTVISITLLQQSLLFPMEQSSLSYPLKEEQSDKKALAQEQHPLVDTISLDFYEKDLHCATLEDSVQAEKTADRGHLDALVDLGLCYTLGNGVEPNPSKAFLCFAQASRNLSNSKALFCLGHCYQDGFGTTQNDKLAFSLYKKSADLGYAPAYYDRGIALFNGRGVQKNEAEALEWFKRAAQEGNKRAKEHVIYCCYHGIGTEKDINQVIILLNDLVEQKDATALYELARIYENGFYTDKNVPRALELYQQAADLGFKKALIALACCYEYHSGPIYNPKKAKALYTRYLQEHDPEGECPICIKPLLSENQERQQRLSCSCDNEHIFHTRCLGRWKIQQNATCPLCREPLKRLS